MAHRRQRGRWMLGAMLLGLTMPMSLPAQKAAPAASAEKPVVLDRVIAIINGEVLLESDVREEVRLSVLQPIAISESENTTLRAARRLTSRALILRQMKDQQQINYSVSDDELKKSLLELRTQIPACQKANVCATDKGWQSFLQSNGLTQPEVESYWRQRLEILKFIQARFGTGVRIPRQDIEKYYQTNVVPVFEKQKQTPPTLASVQSHIRDILLQQQVNSMLRDWLESLREQGNVQVVDPAYAQIAPKEDEDDDSGGGA